LLALNVKIKLYSRKTLIELDEWLKTRAEIKHKVILTDVVMVNEAQLNFEYSARTPKDRPLVFAAAAVWPTAGPGSHWQDMEVPQSWF